MTTTEKPYTVRDDLTPGDAEASIRAFAEAFGLTLECTFIPLSKAPNEWPARDGKLWVGLTFDCVLLRRREGRDPHQIWSGRYRMGSGFCKANNASATALASAHLPERTARAALIEWECEHGRPGRFLLGNIMPAGGLSGAPYKADLPSVLSSLAMDAQAIDYAKFEDWAEEFGYDPDSRKGEAIYRACLETGLSLRQTLGEEGLADLQTLARCL